MARSLDQITKSSKRAASAVVISCLVLAIAGLSIFLGKPRPASAPLPPGAAKHLVILVMDTLRADRMSVYGHTRQTTPFFDEKSGEMLRYATLRSVAPWTVPTHATLFTGLLPSMHKAQWGHALLEDRHTTLAEILEDEGFCTVGRSANHLVNDAAGLTQGFDDYAIVRSKPHLKSQTILAELPDLLDDALDEGCRLFLYVNVMDTHIPYQIGTYGPEMGLTGTPPVQDPGRKWQISAGNIPFSSRKKAQHKSAYDASVRQVNDVAESLYDALHDKGMLEETALIFTSDHGDGLGEHPEIGHSVSVWEEQLAIPLIVRLPQAQRGGDVVEASVSQVGIFSSALDWLAIDVPSKGKPSPTLEDTSKQPQVAEYRSYFSEADRGWNVKMTQKYPKLAKRTDHRHIYYCGKFKLTTSPSGRTWFHDLSVDPTEQHNLSQDENAEADLLRCRGQQEKLLASGLYTPFDYQFTEKELRDTAEREDIDALKALGYIED